MKYLLDTHVLLWVAAGTLPKSAQKFFSDENELYYSPASIWEITIKAARNKSDFEIDLDEFCSCLRFAGYAELPITTKHTIALGSLPPIHKDPFDRILIAQAISERIELLTSDEIMAKYPFHIIRI